MPCSGSSISNRRILLSRQPSPIPLMKAEPDRLVLSSRTRLVATLLSSTPTGRSAGSHRGRFRTLESVLPKVADLSRLQTETRIGGQVRGEQLQDVVLDDRCRRRGQKAQIPKGRFRFSPLGFRDGKP